MVTKLSGTSKITKFPWKLKIKKSFEILKYKIRLKFKINKIYLKLQNK